MKNATQPRNKYATIQEVGTDPSLFNTLNKAYHFTHDLACNTDNMICPLGFPYPETDSLDQDWHKLDGWLWLNPPYANIKPWAEKCKHEMKKGARIVMLVPASVGSWWFYNHVVDKAYVVFLTGRLTFKNHKTPFPKDCMLCIYDEYHTGFAVWDWKHQPAKEL